MGFYQKDKRNMVGVLKSFDRTSHDKNDGIAKKAMIKFLDKHLPYCVNIENPDIHGIDILSLYEGVVVACWEVERRAVFWKGNTQFPFKEVNCLERKDHQWRKESTFTSHINFPIASDCMVCYVQMNDICTRIAVIDGDIVLKYNLTEWSNRYVKSGEYVRQVPITEALQYEID
jgi:hypothetical protein